VVPSRMAQSQGLIQLKQPAMARIEAGPYRGAGDLLDNRRRRRRRVWHRQLVAGENEGERRRSHACKCCRVRFDRGEAC